MHKPLHIYVVLEVQLTHLQYNLFDDPKSSMHRNLSSKPSVVGNRGPFLGPLTAPISHDKIKTFKLYTQHILLLQPCRKFGVSPKNKTFILVS